MRCFHKVYVLPVVAVVAAAPFVAPATEVFTTKEYVDETRVASYQGTVNQMLQVNGSGKLVPVTPANAIATDGSMLPVTENAVYDYAENKDNKLDGTTLGEKISDLPAGGGAGEDQTMYPSAAAVKEYAVQKPTTATAGQVLMYGTGATAASRPVAQYIQVPMANGDPADSGTVSGTASIWLQ